ncbi:hypothetical protein [Hoeflea poritis]|uniref:Transposase n=1 Tax=Hoeflea poritis TaxID=2993659 RepID=A0ABT4VPU2_9HYPH|nr:hypothetical protein [Hoeflea poritis]MDA4846733.1 hypothetical protein [Hoeflea poritis]
MDKSHLLNAVRYVTINPIRAELVTRTREWQWSSARAHLTGNDDHVVTVEPVLERTGKFTAFLDKPIDGTKPYGAVPAPKPSAARSTIPPG